MQILEENSEVYGGVKQDPEGLVQLVKDSWLRSSCPDWILPYFMNMDDGSSNPTILWVLNWKWLPYAD